jgi:hypothetical protein
MDYFCYISRAKVDQLYETAAPEAVDEWIERQSGQRNVDTKASAGLSLAGIAKLFSGEVGYGVQRGTEKEWKARVNPVEKLGVVLTAIAADHGEIPALEDCLRTQSFPLYIFHAGEFRVTAPLDDDPTPDRVVTLQSSLDTAALLLDCSLRFFSETDESGRIVIHSGNYRFFQSGMPLTFETVFLFLNRDGSDVFGSPLFLRLHADFLVKL